MFFFFKPKHDKQKPETQPKTKIEAFWRWFEAHNKALLKLSAPVDPLFEELHQALRKVDSDLGFEISIGDKLPRELVISAGGHLKAFPMVEALVTQAPDLPDWDVMAFKPRRTLKGVTLPFTQFVRPEQCWFKPRLAETPLGLDIYMGGYCEELFPIFGQAAYFMLDVALGEYDVTTQIGMIEFYPLPTDPQAAGLLPLFDLADYVDDRALALEIESAGRGVEQSA